MKQQKQITHTQAYKAVFEKGKFVKGDFLRLWVYANKEFAGSGKKITKPRIVVSKKVSPLATERNRWKRRIRAAAISLNPEADPNRLWVIQARSNKHLPPSAAIRMELKTLFQKAGLLK